MSIYYADGTKAMAFIESVDTFGAVGDGVHDDADAIQDALESVRNGGMIIFPKGIYKISKPLIVYPNQTIDINGATILAGSNTNNLMRGYCTQAIGEYDGPHDIIVQNGIFDGGDYENNITMLGFCHGKNIIIRNCTFKNAYGAWHNVEINSSKYVLIENCNFEGLRKTSSNGCMIQVDSYNNNLTWPWSDGAVDNTISCMVEIKGCHFYDNIVSPAIGNHSAMAVDYIKIHDCTFEGLTSERGAVAFQSANHVDCCNNTFVGCDTIMTVSSVGSNTLSDNRIDGATTISSGNVTERDNVVDGVLSA